MMKHPDASKIEFNSRRQPLVKSYFIAGFQPQAIDIPGQGLVKP